MFPLVKPYSEPAAFQNLSKFAYRIELKMFQAKKNRAQLAPGFFINDYKSLMNIHD